MAYFKSAARPFYNNSGNVGPRKLKFKIQMGKPNLLVIVWLRRVWCNSKMLPCPLSINLKQLVLQDLGRQSNFLRSYSRPAFGRPRPKVTNEGEAYSCLTCPLRGRAPHIRCAPQRLSVRQSALMLRSVRRADARAQLTAAHPTALHRSQSREL